jgi:hypothetical protein
MGPRDLGVQMPFFSCTHHRSNELYNPIALREIGSRSIMCCADIARTAHTVGGDYDRRYSRKASMISFLVSGAVSCDCRGLSSSSRHLLRFALH